MLIVFIIIFIALYELITVMYYESLKIRLVKVGAFIDYLNTFGSTEDKQIFYKFLKEVNTESIRCNAKLDITIENASKPELWYNILQILIPLKSVSNFLIYVFIEM